MYEYSFELNVNDWPTGISGARGGRCHLAGLDWNVALINRGDVADLQLSLLNPIPSASLRVTYSLQIDQTPNAPQERKAILSPRCRIIHADAVARIFAIKQVSNLVVKTVRLNLSVDPPMREPMANPDSFAAPNRESNIVLIIDGKKLHISKELLSDHSPVFAAMFFGGFSENGKDEVEINDIVYQEFLDLLHVIYREMAITDRMVPHILKLADRFQMESLMNDATKYLIEAQGRDVEEKLFFADQYRLSSLKDHCLNSYANYQELVEKLKASGYYDYLSTEVKAAICDKIMMLKRE